MKLSAILLSLALLFGVTNGIGDGSLENAAPVEESDLTQLEQLDDTEINDVEVSSSNTDEPQDLIVADYNYVLSYGYVEYAVEIENPNTDYAAQYANIKITSRHEDGTIGFSEDWVVSTLAPGSTTYWAGQAGNGDTVETDTIEITVSVNEDNWTKPVKAMPENLYTFDNVSVVPDGLGYLTATGEITLNEDYSEDYWEANRPMLVCILKDAEGKIVAGFNGYQYEELKVGSPSIFDISSMFDAVDFATAEMHANLW